MKKLPRIISIESLEKPMSIIAKWSDGTTRINELANLIATDKRFAPLSKRNVFSGVTVMDGTLSWPGVLQKLKIENTIIEVALDLDPDTLYENSMAVDPVDIHAELGRRIMARRIVAGLTQEALGKAAGKDRHYISRIESGAKDVSFSSLTSILTGLNADFDLLNGLGTKNKQVGLKKRRSG